MKNIYIQITRNRNSNSITARIRAESSNRLTQTTSSIAALTTLSLAQSSSAVQQIRNSPSNSNQSENEAKRRHEIFKIVCNNIDNWRDLGRCLDMRDVELNHIGQDQEIRNDMKLITNRILEQMELKYGDEFYVKLCEALIEARRKDILRDLKKCRLV